MTLAWSTATKNTGPRRALSTNETQSLAEWTEVFLKMSHLHVNHEFW